MEMLLKFFFRYLLAPLLVVIMLFVLNNLKGVKGQLNIKNLLIYLSLSSLFLALPAFFGVLKNEFVWGGLLLTIFSNIILGFIFYRLYLIKMIEKVGVKTIGGTLLLLGITAILGGWVYSIVFRWISGLPYTLWASFNILWYTLPFLLLISKQYYLQIPLPIYRLWNIEGGRFDRNYWEKVDSFPFEIVNVRIKRRVEDLEEVSLSVRFPDGITLGDWFNWLVEDQQKRFSGASIEIMEKDSAFEWLFYTPKYFPFPLFIRVLDPNMTRDENGIRKKGQRIYIKRVVKNITEK